jgi:hypothetical protein
MMLAVAALLRMRTAVICKWKLLASASNGDITAELNGSGGGSSAADSGFAATTTTTAAATKQALAIAEAQRATCRCNYFQHGAASDHMCS